MSRGKDWTTIVLYDLGGHVVSRCRVPTSPRQPGVVLWQNRYFKQRGITPDYIEATFFMVPIGGHFHSEDEGYGEPKAEAAK